MAALVFLKTAPGINSHRTAVAGHSVGGQLTLYSLRIATPQYLRPSFAGAARSWEGSPELRERPVGAIRKINAPIVLIHAGNDYGTAAGHDLGEELERLHKPYLLKMYPQSV